MAGRSAILANLDESAPQYRSIYFRNADISARPTARIQFTGNFLERIEISVYWQDFSAFNSCIAYFFRPLLTGTVVGY